jgi:hypothetical protein
MVFLADLPPKLAETDVENTFSEFGNVRKVVLVYFDKEHRNSRGEKYFGVWCKLGVVFVEFLNCEVGEFFFFFI